MRPHFIRSHERMTHKRCPRKWYWAWRKGYVPLRQTSMGALDLGTWVHAAFELWYLPGYERASASLELIFTAIAEAAVFEAKQNGLKDDALETAWELVALGQHMCRAYQAHYEDDQNVEVIGAEIPLEFSLGEGIIHILKPDMLFRYRGESPRDYWLMEHKTAKSLSGRTAHLTIDDQARPYGAMAELACRNAGIIGKGDRIAGITYNFVRKGLPDLRKVNAKGEALNKDGSVSKVQPAPMFLRKRITMTNAQKAITLRRVRAESIVIRDTTQGLRTNYIQPEDLPFTPHHSCPRFCQFFAMCESLEAGADISGMERTMFRRENPYEYAESTDEPAGFELG